MGPGRQIYKMTKLPSGSFSFDTVDNCSKLLYTVCDGGDHMTIIINNSSQVPIYEQISRRVKELIASGELIE